MKLENNFTIDAPIDKAWEALNDPETVAPCFPGATLTHYEGDSFTGTVKVKLGPIAMTYKGKGTYVSRDEAAHEVVIDASGRDSRGNGTANAKVTGSLAADGPDRTAVSMVTDMTITGKPAQFGRGVISDVADKIIGQFAACVARKLAPATADEAVPVAAAASEATSDIPTPPARPARRAAAAAGGSEAISDSVPERVSTNGASPGTGGTSETEAPAADMTPGAAAIPEAPDAGGTSEAEAPAADMTPGAAGGGGAPGAPGTSEAEAPAVDMTPGSAATTPVPAARRGGTGLKSGPVRSEVDAIDLLDHAGAPVLQRLLPVLGGGLLLVLVILLIRRLRAG
jgi:carbon monoxide dehydrogenase subunit G